MNEPFPASLPDDVLAVWSIPATFYVVRDGSRLYLIDTGFIGSMGLLRRALRRRGWQDLPIAGIFLTHGHLDHAHNTSALAKSTGAWVAAHRLDRKLIAGTFRHRGMARVCGALETLGHALLRHQPHTPDRWLEDGEELPMWGGLRVVHLPGHTAGHVGYYSERRGLLFSGDLFASTPIRGSLPPNILNDEPEKIPSSITRALALEPRGILPCHGLPASPAKHLERLRKLDARLHR